VTEEPLRALMGHPNHPLEELWILATWILVTEELLRALMGHYHPREELWILATWIPATEELLRALMGHPNHPREAPWEAEFRRG
jgi:hypothetical protein